MERQEKRRDVENERHWRRVIGEAARSRLSIRRFCQQRKLKESQFYWWSRLRAGRERQEARAFGRGSRSKVSRTSGRARFALVSGDGGELGSAGIELVLRATKEGSSLFRATVSSFGKVFQSMTEEDFAKYVGARYGPQSFPRSATCRA